MLTPGVGSGPCAANRSVATSSVVPSTECSTGPLHTSDQSPAEVLTRRLAQLGDPDHMRPVLQDAVEQFSPCAFEVEGYEIDFCKVTPWHDISLALTLTMRSIGTGHRSRQIVSGTVLANEDEALRQLQQEQFSARPVNRRAGEDGIRTSIVLVPEMAMVLRLFPSDSALDGLAHATDRAAMTALLTAHLPECRDRNWTIRDVEYEPVQYKPGRLCTLRYTVTLDHAGHVDSKQIDVFGKVYRDDRWRRSFELITATWNASLASRGAWRAAAPIAAVGSWRFIVQSAVGGREFRQPLGDLTKPGARPEEIRQVERHLEAVASAVRSMQQSPVRLGPLLDFTALAAAQRDNLEHLRGIHGALAGELHRLRAEIELLASACPASELGLAHGDFAHGNVILDGERVGIIDFDRAGQAEPAYDVAYFLTHLTSFTLRHPERATHLGPLAEHFREAYLELAPAVSPRRLALYEALDLSAYVLRNFRKRSHQSSWLDWARGQIDSAWQRLEVARSEHHARGRASSAPTSECADRALAEHSPAASTGRLGYLVTAFPRVSETFIINEIIELEHQGFDLHIYSMTDPTDLVRHRLADQIRSPITYLPNPLWLSLGTVLADHVWLFRRSPRAYLATLLGVLTSANPGLVRRFGQAACLVRVLEHDGATHLHAGFVHGPGSMAWLVSLMSGLPFSVSAHARDLYHSPPALLRKKLAAARVVFTCTRYNVSHLERLSRDVGAIRVRHAYHGTDLHRFQFGAYGAGQPPVILAVARLVEKKGIADLIRACALLHDRNCAFSCHIVGDGQLRASLARLIRRLGLDELVTLEGAVDQDHVLAWYRRATVLVQPCQVTRDGDRDGIPNVLIEAAACGLPIVTTPVSGIPELVEDGQSGLLVPPCNPAALARSIETMLQSADLRERLRLEARRKVEQAFDVRRNALAIGRELRAVMTPPPKDVGRNDLVEGEEFSLASHLSAEPR